MKLKGYKNINFYADKTNHRTIYAEFVIPSSNNKMPEREKLVPLNSIDFESYIRAIVHAQIDGDKSVGKMLQELKDYFINYGCSDFISPKVRIAGRLKNGLIEYDLCNYNQEYIKITPGSWTISSEHTYKFLKNPNNGEQVVPRQTRKNLIGLLAPFVNADKADLILFVVWLVQAFCQGSHSALLIMAGKGSGKTFLSKTISKIIDPSAMGATVLPLNEDHLLTTLTNSYVVAFDNTDELSKEQSNILCQAVTGATYTKRVSYSTNESASFALHNTLIINGINTTPSESDFAERCLLLNLKSLANKRKPESEMEEALNELLPEILGAIFETISKAMEIIDSITPKRVPRMLDSYIDMLAIAKALDISETEFEKIYFDNLAAIDKARSEIPIVQAVKEYMTSGLVSGNKFSGTMTEVANKIKAHYSGDKRDLPKNASHFGRKLRSEIASLLAAGYIVNIDTTKQDATHVSIIKK